MKRIILTGLVVVAAAAGLFLAYQGGKQSVSGSAKAANDAQAQSAKYDLLAKRIFIENPSQSWVNFSSLRSGLNDYFKKNGLKGSVYFEYLPTGTSIRVYDSYQQVAASLIKLPAAMELYKAAELGKVNLDQKIKLKQEWLNSDYGDLYKKGAGYELSIRDAARIMLEDSDNTALRAVLASYDSKLAADQLAFGSLDVDFSQNRDQTINIGARGYASFLKCLYFACYNNQNDSQEILSYLAQSKFNDRIVAGVGPNAGKVAHKIGVFNTRGQGDCGIVYYPNRNYALCVMVEGQDPQASQRIAAISKQVYGFVDGIKPQ